MKFKVGDRVAVYYGEYRNVGTVLCVGTKLLHIETGPKIADYHPKAVRLLKKKERRRIRVTFGEAHQGTYKIVEGIDKCLTDLFKPHEVIEFIEIRKKK